MNICIYGASSNDIASTYFEQTRQLGQLIAQHSHGLVFGGGARGLMGAAAEGAYENGGYILGVAPSFFHVDGVLFERCNEFIYTKTMRERKQTMEDHADAFVMVPGGIGTLEEFFEILTLKQLARHQKPIAIYNCNGYYNKLLQFLQHMTKENFMKDTCRQLFGVFENPEDLLHYLETYQPPEEEITYFKPIH